MKIVNVKIPDGTYGFGDDAELGEYEFRKLREAGAEALVYSYAAGSYEGSGDALILKDGKWSHVGLGHCSCYGPLDDVPDLRTGQTLAELLAATHPAYAKQLVPLFAAAAGIADA